MAPTTAGGVAIRRRPPDQEVPILALSTQTPAEVRSGLERTPLTIGGAGPFNIICESRRGVYGDGVQFRNFRWSTEYGRETIHVVTSDAEGVSRKIAAPGYVLLPNLPNNSQPGQFSPQEKETMRQDMLLELQVETEPVASVDMFTTGCPRSVYDENKLNIKPRSFSRQQYYPCSIGKGLDGQDILLFPTWHPDPPRNMGSQQMPDPLHLPLTGIETALQDLERSNIQVTLNFAFHGDSTVTGLIRPVEYWIKSTEHLQGSPKWGRCLPMYARGKCLHSLVKSPAVDTSEVDVFILKYQVDMINIMGLQMANKETEEMRISAGLRQYSRQIDWLLEKSRENCLGAMVILVGPNPINSPSCPRFRDRPDFSDLVARMDTYLRERVSKHADVYYISVLDVMAAFWPLTDLKSVIAGVHMTTTLNFYIAREIRRVVIAVMASRATLGLGRVPRFSIWDATHGRLNATQTQYIEDVIGLARVPDEESASRRAGNA